MLIAFVIFLISVVGVGIIILKKVPVLVQVNVKPIDKSAVFSAIKAQIKDKTIKDFSFEMFLHKLLSKLRVMILKTERQIGCWLSSLRQKSINKNCFKDNHYWKKVKK